MYKWYINHESFTLDKTVTYGKDGRIIVDFSMVTLDCTTADNHKNVLGTGANNLENDTWAPTNLYSGQV